MSDRNIHVDEAAQLTNVPPATLRWWRARSTGPRSFKVGRRIAYRETDVRAWLEAQYAGSTAMGGTGDAA